MSIKIEITAETPEQLHEQLRGLFLNKASGLVDQPQVTPTAPEPVAPVAESEPAVSVPEPEPRKRRARKQEPEAPAPEPVAPPPPPAPAPAPVEDALTEEPVTPPPPPPPPASEPLNVSSQDVLLLGCLVQYGFEDRPTVISALTEVLGENKSLNAAAPEKLTALAEKFIGAINTRSEGDWQKAEARDTATGKKHVASVAGLPKSILGRINHFAK